MEAILEQWPICCKLALASWWIMHILLLHGQYKSAHFTKAELINFLLSTAPLLFIYLLVRSKHWFWPWISEAGNTQ
jgi:hypothetical protein